MTAFVNLKGTVIRTDHVSAVTPIQRGQAQGDHPDHFVVMLIGAGYGQSLAIWGKGRTLTADRNKLLRAMGAVL